MNYTDHSKLTNEDLVACYPRRIEMAKSYELWQFPYVKDDILYDEDDIIGITFNESLNRIAIISEYPHHLEDTDYINRIISLVHDISNKFSVDKHLVNNDSTSSIEEILQIIRDNK